MCILWLSTLDTYVLTGNPFCLASFIIIITFWMHIAFIKKYTLYWLTMHQAHWKKVGLDGSIPPPPLPPNNSESQATNLMDFFFFKVSSFYLQNRQKLN